MVDSIGENVFGTIIGTSPVIKESIELSKRVAKSTASILIRGESGTGKEVFARAIYKESGCEGLFIPVNCSAVPDQLFESEFFGYESGAFTGASKKGKWVFLNWQITVLSFLMRSQTCRCICRQNSFESYRKGK